jgi:DNA-binding LacI/PurR family transcriptional regulator
MTRRKHQSANRMAEVARRAGVSLSTVSRALSGSPLISEATRSQVRRTAEKLGYQVDAAGSSLRTGMTRTVAVVIPLAHAADQGVSDPFFLEILGALAEELASGGYSMLLHEIKDDPARWIRSIARGRRADGVIVIGQSLHHDSLDQLADAGIPLVVWGARLPGQHYVTIGSDNHSGGHDATAHLLAQGCRRIVFLGDPAAPEVAARRDGYLAALRAAGIARDARLEVAVRFGSDTAYRAVAALVDAGTQFDGIVACSDVFAINAMRALAERDRKVPEDVAITGFDDIPFAAFTTPPLTTIRQDYQAGARLLVENLLRQVRGERAGTVVIPALLVVRGSSLRENYRALPSIRRTRGAAAAPESVPARAKKTRAG